MVTCSQGDQVEHGVHYHFVDVPAFERMVAAGEFLEHARVFDNYYGTSAASARDELGKGGDVVLEIDWQGARQVRQRLHSRELPPSLQQRVPSSGNGRAH